MAVGVVSIVVFVVVVAVTGCSKREYGGGGDLVAIFLVLSSIFTCDPPSIVLTGTGPNVSSGTTLIRPLACRVPRRKHPRFF